MAKLTFTTFYELKKQYDAEQKMIEELRENPMTESEVRKMVQSATRDRHNAEFMSQLTATIEYFKSVGLIVPDSTEVEIEQESTYIMDMES